MTDVTTLSMRIAEEIRVLMVRKHVNQKQLASRLDVSAMWVSGRLTGQTEIAVNDLPRIASALGVQLTDLLPREVLGRALHSPTDEYLPVTERPTRSASRPVDNRPSGRPGTSDTIGVRRTSRVQRPPSRKGA